MIQGLAGANDIELVTWLDSSLSVDIIEANLSDDVLWLFKAVLLGILLVLSVLNSGNVAANVLPKHVLLLEGE